MEKTVLERFEVKEEGGKKYIQGVATGWYVEGKEIVIMAGDLDGLEAALAFLGMDDFEPERFHNLQCFDRGRVDRAQEEDPTATTLSRTRLGGEK